MLALVLVPAVVVTVIGPVVAVAGTIASNCVSDGAFVVVASTAPLNFTVRGPKKFFPLIVILVPRGPNPGENPVTNGALPMTVNSSVLVAEPKELETEIRPVVAPAGTSTWS